MPGQSSRERLGADQASVKAILPEQIGMRALLDRCAVGDGYDQVGVAHGGKTMGDHDGGSAAA